MLRFTEFAFELEVNTEELNALEQMLKELDDDPPFLYYNSAHRDNYIVIYVDNTLSIDIDRVCNTLQAFITQFNREPIVFSWAQYTNRPVPGNFGGGVAYVSEDEIRVVTTNDILVDLEEEFDV